MTLISTDGTRAENHKDISFNDRMKKVENQELQLGDIQNGKTKSTQQKRISKFAESSSDESENNDDVDKAVADRVESLNSDCENLPISNTHDLADSSSSDISHKSQGFEQRKLKRRVLELAESSDSDDNGDVSSHLSKQFINLKTKVIEEDVAFPEDGLSYSDSNADFAKKKKIKRRVAKPLQSSDESDSDIESSYQASHQSMDTGEPAVCSEVAGSSRMSVADANLKCFESSEDSDNNSCNSDDDTSSSSDDNAPPIRIFRNKDAAAMNARGYDSGNDTADDEARDDYSSSPPHIPFKSRRSSKPNSNLEIKSETQRLIRESSVNLPYHVPEVKKLSDFLKRPIGFQEKAKRSSEVTDVANEPAVEEKPTQAADDDGVPGPSQVAEPVPHNDQMETEMEGATLTKTAGSRKKAQFLALRGVHIPELNSPKPPLTAKSENEFVDLDSEEAQPIKENVSNFMQRFLKQSNSSKICMKRKKVQFNIIRKEERADGSGVELVSDVVASVDNAVQEPKGESLPGYKTLREKLAAKMKQRRTRERIKREEIYKLDNEELGKEEDEEEEELDDDWSDAESEQSGEEDEEVVNDWKNHMIEDDDVEDDGCKLEEESLDTTQPLPSEVSLSNASSISRASQHTRSDFCPQLSRESSMLLFDDSVKKSSHGHEEINDDHHFEAFDTSTIPLHQPEISNISEIAKPAKSNFDDDSYFCSERSLTTSTNTSQSRIECQSQFLDSDGFLKEPKASKSLSSLLPPGGEDDNANDCNMSQLLELCSGKFQESDASPHVSDVEASSDVNGKLIDESFGFQVEPDTFKESKLWKNFSDVENSDTEEPDEGITIIRKKKNVTEQMTKNFLEEEAELSGDDVGSDEDEADEDDEYEEEENDEILPQEEVIHQQVNKVHLKQLLDEDQRDIDLLQEAFVEEAVEMKRNRKFRWKHIDDNLTQDLFHSDDENEHCDEEKENEPFESEDTQWRMLRLEREEFLDTKTSDGNTALTEHDEDDSQLLKMGRSAIQRSRSRVLSEINEDSRGTKPLTLSRSSSLTAPKLPSKNSFLCRKPEVLSKFANFKESKVIKGAVNSDRMVFKTVSPSSKKQTRKPKRPSSENMIVTKKLKLDEDSNSIFDLFET